MERKVSLQTQAGCLQLMMFLTIVFILLLLLLNQSTVLTLMYKNLPTIQESAKYFPKSSNTYSEKHVAGTNGLLSIMEMNYIRKEIEMRKQKLTNLCLQMNNDASSAKNTSRTGSTLPNMIIDVRHGISWCPIYKAASSIWMKNFAMLGGFLTESVLNLLHQNILQVNTIVKQAFPHDLDADAIYKKLSQTKKFLIVRHPLERLLSAYRDKLENMDGRKYYYQKFGRHITNKYRGRRLNQTQLEPTFAEFLQFIVEEKYFDEHWALFFDTCKPCIIQYDYILKFETFHRDQQFLIQESGLYKYLEKQNSFENINPKGITTKALVEKYLQQVPVLLLEKINKLYEKDFTLFSY